MALIVPGLADRLLSTLFFTSRASTSVTALVSTRSRSTKSARCLLSYEKPAGSLRHHGVLSVSQARCHHVSAQSCRPRVPCLVPPDVESPMALQRGVSERWRSLKQCVR